MHLILLACRFPTGILQPPPNPETPIVMFGLGSGVAPFRGFMQHRESLLKQGQKLGPATLYVGFRHEEKDYYLREDFKRWIDQGVLSAVHPAFSHDNREQRGGKLYFISDLIREKPKELTQALLLHEEEDKAHKVHSFYCGPALGIPETIQNAMESAVQNEKGGAKGSDEAKAFMNRMVRMEDRFHAECF